MDGAKGSAPFCEHMQVPWMSWPACHYDKTQGTALQRAVGWTPTEQVCLAPEWSANLSWPT